MPDDEEPDSDDDLRAELGIPSSSPSSSRSPGGGVFRGGKAGRPKSKKQKRKGKGMGKERKLKDADTLVTSLDTKQESKAGWDSVGASAVVSPKKASAAAPVIPLQQQKSPGGAQPRPQRKSSFMQVLRHSGVGDTLMEKQFGFATSKSRVQYHPSPSRSPARGRWCFCERWASVLTRPPSLSCRSRLPRSGSGISPSLALSLSRLSLFPVSLDASLSCSLSFPLERANA